jgi:hypothetical protein
MSSENVFVNNPKAAGGRPKHVTVYETGRDAQVRFAVGMQAIIAATNGAPNQGKKSDGGKRCLGK